ncbi:DUF1761 domain-containing protein [Aureimonas phyllosphaerae]|uniref:DUF1761 domain-containing protein n=1 Tax=Aureimonas phyllosphaerae TaxID=1166078 RepID=A0A7W6BZ19_9HYPH|nr:DUF1761 domain-containing protein [Aureimonas phyllosphaerae]MBB3937798.1 hypothetical protein [Aureimonas phyllosphaerae]MBB3961871.1 hypothetical protein [Aureimonas phyllosphaerae]SFF51098.1 hypothetical protein SAMN05216566_11969 [Aureimonas phyllosphaerae]
MVYILQNLFPILAAAVAGLLLGLVWWKATDGSAASGRPSGRFLAVAFVAEFWLACILAGALILAPPEAGTWVMAIGTPIVIWVGFVLPALVVSFGRRAVPGRTIAAEGGHWLAVMVLQAVVLQAIGLTPPPT